MSRYSISPRFLLIFCSNRYINDRAFINKKVFIISSLSNQPSSQLHCHSLVYGTRHDILLLTHTRVQIQIQNQIRKKASIFTSSNRPCTADVSFQSTSIHNQGWERKALQMLQLPYCKVGGKQAVFLFVVFISWFIQYASDNHKIVRLWSLFYSSNVVKNVWINEQLKERANKLFFQKSFRGT